MKIEKYISICRNCGQNIRTIGGNYFKSHLWKSYSYPLNSKIHLNDDLISSLRWKYLITTIFTESLKKNTVEFILNTSKYDIEMFSRKTRNRVNKSLHNCSFKRPPLEDLVNFGLNINRQTLDRQHRKDATLTNLKHWSKYIASLYAYDEIIILGAYYSGRMVGYIITADLEGDLNIIHAFIDRQDSEITSPMMGLIYTLCRQLIEINGSCRISYGLDSLDPEPELNRFKRNMLFKQIPSTRVYVLNPILLIVFRFIINYYLNVLKRRNIKNPLVRKIIKLYQGSRLIQHESGR